MAHAVLLACQKGSPAITGCRIPQARSPGQTGRPAPNSPCSRRCRCCSTSARRLEQVFGVQKAQSHAQRIGREDLLDSRDVLADASVDRSAQIRLPGPNADRLRKDPAHRLAEHRARNAVAVLDLPGHRHHQRDEIAIEKRKGRVESVQRADLVVPFHALDVILRSRLEVNRSRLRRLMPLGTDAAQLASRRARVKNGVAKQDGGGGEPGSRLLSHFAGDTNDRGIQWRTSASGNRRPSTRASSVPNQRPLLTHVLPGPPP